MKKTNKVREQLTIYRPSSKKSRILSYRVILEPAEEGGFTVTVPSLPGCISEGDTKEEALRNIRDAIQGYLEIGKKYGDAIPPSDVIEETVKVAI